MNCFLKIGLAGFLAALGPASGDAQSLFVLKHLGISEGLADYAAQDLLQDKNGFIWVATENGLQEYDGYHFTTFHHIPGDSSSIPSDQITKFWNLSSGKLLLATAFQGFSLFDPSTGKCIKMGNQPVPVGLDFAFSAAEDQEGNIWMTGEHTLVEYRQGDQSFHAYDSLFKDAGGGFLGDLFFDRQGRLWLDGRGDGVYVLDPARGRLYSWRDNPEHLAVLDRPRDVIRLFGDRENRLWVSYGDTLLDCFEIDSNSVIAHLNTKTSVTHIFEDRGGRLWLYTANLGFLCYDLGKDRLTEVQYHERDQVTHFMEDKDGLFWLACEHGIQIADPNGGRFTFYGTNPKETVSLFQSRSGDVWLMSYGGGILKMDSTLKFRKEWRFPSGIGDSSNRAWVMTEGDDGKLWVGCQHGWLSIYDPASGDMHILRPPAFQEKSVMSMLRDGSGNIWFGLYVGLACWDKRTGTFRRYDGMLPYRGLTYSSADFMTFGEGGLLWLGTINMGLQIFDPATGRFTRQYEPPQSLSSALLTCVAPLNEHVMAIGMSAGGIDFFDDRRGRSTQLTTADGLPSNNIVALDARSRGYLWVATPVGICRVRLKDHRVTKFGRGDGLGQEPMTALQFCRLRDGRMLIGCKGGFYAFRPDSIPEESPPERVYITGLRLEDRSIGLDSASSGSLTVTLSYDHNDLDIDYVSLHFLKAETLHYFYRLVGYDPDWVDAGPDRSVHYHHLPAGHYHFEVRCENQDGISCAQPTSFGLIVLPPFWKTPWFFTLCALAAGTLIYLLYLGRIQRIKMRLELRNRIAGDLHDDIGSTLSGINIYSRMALKRLGDSPEESAGLLAKISDRSEKMMEALSDIVWSINSRNDHMGDVLARMKEYSAEMLEPQQIAWSLEVADAVSRLELDMVARKEFYLIFKEALNNAAKYASCTCIDILLHKRDGFLVLTLRDNGIGFDRISVVPGNGLLNMHNRARKMKGRIDIESSPGKGTTVRLWMPLA